MGAQIYFDNYFPMGDILVMAVSLVIFVLLASSYVNKTKIYGVYVNIVFYTFFCGIDGSDLSKRLSPGHEWRLSDRLRL